MADKREPPLQIRLTAEEKAWLERECQRLELTQSVVVHRLFDRAMVVGQRAIALEPPPPPGPPPPARPRVKAKKEPLLPPGTPIAKRRPALANQGTARRHHPACKCTICVPPKKPKGEKK